MPNSFAVRHCCTAAAVQLILCVLPHSELSIPLLALAAFKGRRFLLVQTLLNDTGKMRARSVDGQVGSRFQLTPESADSESADAQ
jgi:hypothetical protein